MTEFFDLLDRPLHAVVIGHFVPEPSDASGRCNSNLFIVTEVLQGDLKTQPYRLVLAASWRNLCKMSTIEFTGPPGENVLLLISKVDEGMLYLSDEANIVDGDVITTRSYIKKSQKPYDWESLGGPQELKVKLTRFKRWLKSDRSQPVPWQVIPKKAN